MVEHGDHVHSGIIFGFPMTQYQVEVLARVEPGFVLIVCYLADKVVDYVPFEEQYIKCTLHSVKTPHDSILKTFLQWHQAHRTVGGELKIHHQ